MADHFHANSAADIRDAEAFRVKNIPDAGMAHCVWSGSSNAARLERARAAGFDTRTRLERYMDGFAPGGRHRVTGTSLSDFKRMPDQDGEIALALGERRKPREHVSPPPADVRAPTRPALPLTVASHDRAEALKHRNVVYEFAPKPERQTEAKDEDF